MLNLDSSVVLAHNKLMPEQKYILRPIRLSDSDARHRFWVELSYEQSGIVHTCSEIEIHTHETSDKIRDFLSMRRGLWLLALNHDQHVIGEIDIYIKNLSRIKHVGILTIGVLKAHQSQGLGSALMSAALSWAKTQGLKRIELNVFASNIKAQNLYKKFGFVIEGVRKNFLRHEDNSYEDDLLMAVYL